MRAFYKFLKDRGFQPDACKALVDQDFYRLAQEMYESLETIADPGTAALTHAATVDVLRAHARLALHPLTAR